MLEENVSAEELIRKYLMGTTTMEEEALLESWYVATANLQPTMPGEVDYHRIGKEILKPLRAEQLGKPAITCPIRRWPRAAAATLLFVSIASLFFFQKSSKPRVAQYRPIENDIPPARAQAVLTLLDGQTIAVNDDSDTLARQGTTIIRSLNGELAYSTSHPSAQQGRRIVYNTLTTGPGEHYALVLSDGTKVWLNVASSITYPIVFNGNERRVKVSGEAYFEIAHNPKQPFRVEVKDQVIEDIGTHLNINAYDDEPSIKTTLLEGGIKVTKGPASAILTPGQQATIRPEDHSFQLKQVDASEAIAWKNGYFYFDRADIQTVMRELARWYNVRVVYKGKLTKRTFRGKVYRNINGSEALGILAYFGAHFHVEGKTITVY
jgi:transmembrane sensor